MNIIVYSISPSTTSRDLFEYFSSFGIIENAYVAGDRGYVHMLNRDDGLKILNTLKFPHIKGQRVYLEENPSIGMSREGYRDNFPNPYGNWMDQSRDMMSYEYGVPTERNYSEFVPQNQVNQNYSQNGPKPDEPAPESFVYVDPHGYSRDPTMRPPLEYYYRNMLRLTVG